MNNHLDPETPPPEVGMPIIETQIDPSQPLVDAPIVETQIGQTQDSAGEIECSESWVFRMIHTPEELAAPPQESSRPGFRLPDYEIVKELGRGGMGVVYLARHARLKRLVALKVIRGAGVGTDEVERFRTEAEAVATLQHQNIVQIFEIGEYDGLPFFALEYVDGGNLSAKLAGQPLPAFEAAVLTETLARAIHHAHQKGIVHRDLKPANVLLMADGAPKVTDFGLAKRLNEQDNGLTRTGAVMGTPAYMAPEQAGGQTRDAGPTADIYSLGAMMYELLTGRPPFIGETLMDTIRKVLHEEPLPPSRLAPNIPRDLETICLKCLTKSPAGRYASALGLAQDVERFRSGEPILGRREGLVRKAVRLVRKRGVAIGVSLLILAAVAVAVWAALDSGATRRAAALAREFETGLAEPDWSIDRRDHLEHLADRLATLEPAQGESARRKLADHVAARLREALRQPRIASSDVPVVQAEVDWLNGRDPELAKQLGQELANRLRVWQPRLKLLPPFSDASSAFRPDSIVVGPTGLRRANPTARIVPTVVPSRGHLRALAEFTGDWEAGRELGVYFHASPDAVVQGSPAGYGFIVVAAPRRGVVQEEAPAIPKTTTPTFRETNRFAEVQLVRNGTILRRLPITLPAGPLRIAAERDGDFLRVQANDLPAVTFTDGVPLVGGDRAVLGLLWPHESILSGLSVEELAAPPTASPLEKADEAYERGRFTEALALYENQSRSEGPSSIEARCKAGLCFSVMNRPEDAIREFEAVLTAPGERWPVVAAAQLWLIRLRSKQFDQAEAVLALVSARFTSDQLVQYIPASVREEIGRLEPFPPINFLFPDPKMPGRLEAAARLCNLLQIEFPNRGDLARALAMNREYTRAAEVAGQQLKEALAVEIPGMNGQCWPLRWQCWALRVRGLRSVALEEARKIVVDYCDKTWDDPATARNAQMAFAPFRLELARCHAALGEWDRAEEAIDRYLRDYPKPITNAVFHTQPHLMKGFLLHRKGDEKGAKQAWSRATYSGFLEQLPPGSRDFERKLVGWAPLEHWIAGSLSDTLTDDEAKSLLGEALTSFSTDPLFQQLSTSLQISPKIIREVWRTPRGREAARKLAFLDLEPADYARQLPILLIYERFRQELFGDKPSEEQEEMLFRTVTAGVNLACDGKLNKSQMLQLGFAWKGVFGGLGWAGVSPALPPEVRGPLAYFLGLRYLRLGKPQDAKTLLKSAQELAPRDSPLKKHATAELARMDSK